MKFLIILSLKLCFESECEWDNEAYGMEGKLRPSTWTPCWCLPRVGPWLSTPHSGVPGPVGLPLPDPKLQLPSPTAEMSDRIVLAGEGPGSGLGTHPVVSGAGRVGGHPYSQLTVPQHTGCPSTGGTLIPDLQTQQRWHCVGWGSVIGWGGRPIKSGDWHPCPQPD